MRPQRARRRPVSAVRPAAGGSSSMILFGSTLSPFVRKVVAFATEKGVDFELKPRGIGDPDPDFCKASPFRKMPALQDGDYCLAELERDLPLHRSKASRSGADPCRGQGAGTGHLVRRVRRHDPVRVRTEGLLQPSRRASFPQSSRATSRSRRLRFAMSFRPSSIIWKRSFHRMAASSSATGSPLRTSP